MERFWPIAYQLGAIGVFLSRLSSQCVGVIHAESSPPRCANAKHGGGEVRGAQLPFLGPDSGDMERSDKMETNLRTII